MWYPLYALLRKKASPMRMKKEMKAMLLNR